MPNQREIARILGVHQTTVSLALRGDRSVSAEMTEQVRDMAERLGYRPNAYVTTLMAHIRSGRRPPQRGVMAVLVQGRSRAEWHRTESYRIYQQGMEARAAELGYRIECFFLHAAGMDEAVLGRILETRGIQGIILAPPCCSSSLPALRWERFACVGIGHGWEPHLCDRVANDHARNVLLAFEELGRAGRRRIGMVLDPDSAARRGLKWMAGYLEAQYLLPRSRRVPLYSGVPNPPKLPAFTEWLRTHKVDALLTLTGHQQSYLDLLSLRVPEDIAHACLVRQRNSPLPGVDERNETIGAAAVELVASQIARNEFGIPRHPRLTLIDGRWTVPSPSPADAQAGLLAANSS